MKKILICLVISLLTICSVSAQSQFNGLGMNMGNLQRLSNAKTRSISPENFTGEKGQGGKAQLSDSVNSHKAISAKQARELGQGWKLNPCIKLAPNEIFTLAEISGSGAIQHIWMTPSDNWRLSILRIYWDDEKEPSVECPVGDFFGMGLNKFAQISSLPVMVNPGSGFSCYWTMPFRKKCKITVENLNDRDLYLFYQVDYTLTKVKKDDAYFHAQFRKTPSDHKGYNSDYTMIDGIKGKGQYVGTYMTWQQRNSGWWGEGEIKFFLDGDSKFPTICGTGTEDYFLGSYGFDVNGKSASFTAPYAGVPQVILPDSINKKKYPNYGMYRWHIMDPIRFEKDLKITMQDLGWKDFGQTYLSQQSDITSVVFWYQTDPHNKFPGFPSKKELLENSK